MFVCVYQKLSAEELILLNCLVGEDFWVPWIARRWNQSILEEISPEYSLERLMLKLKLQYFGHLLQRTDSLGKNPDAGVDWSEEEKVEVVGWHHWLDGHEFEQALRVGQGSLACCSPWGSKESDMTEQLNWTVWVLSSMQFYHMCKFVYPLPQLRYRKFHCNRIPSVTLLKPHLSLPILTLILSPWKSLICSTIFSFQNYNNLSHRVCKLWGLAFFFPTQHNSSGIYPTCCTYQ